MQELSIEEKARRYDEAIERVRKMKENPKAIFFEEKNVPISEYIFPELRESEYERIKGAIIEHLRDNNLTEWASWLENQSKTQLEGTFVNVDEVREDFIQEVYRVLDADRTNDRANQIIDAFDRLPTLEFKKQSEYKPVWTDRDRGMTMEWISTKIKFPKSGEQVLTACRNKNMEDGIWLYDLCYYYSNTGWEGRINWEDVLYWTYIDEPKQE